MTVAGWGQWRGFMSDPARGTVCAALVILAGLTPLCGCNVGTGLRQDLANNWIFVPLLVLGLAMGWVSGYSDRHNFYTLPPGPADAVRYAGLALFGLGAALRVCSILTLGPRFTVCATILQGHELVTAGLYRFARHPSYTGALCTLFGWALVFRSGIGLLLAAGMIPPLVSRMNAEERMLDQEFGPAYADYRTKSWRLLPLVY